MMRYAKAITSHSQPALHSPQTHRHLIISPRVSMDSFFGVARRLMGLAFGYRPTRSIPWRRVAAALPGFSNARTAGAVAGSAAAVSGSIGVSMAAEKVGRGAEDTQDRQITVCRLMQPDDANPGGNVHGGTILNMIDQAGWIVATRHANSSPENRSGGVFFAKKALSAALVRVEHMDFIRPMYIGEVAQIIAEVVFTSERSIEVRVQVWAENVAKGERRLTNQAILWYVAVPMDKETAAGRLHSQPVPPLPSNHALQKEVSEVARQRYVAQKASRAQARELPAGMALHALQPDRSADACSPSASQSSLMQVILPSDCHTNSVSQGGVIMKLMDTVAGVTAARHCQSRRVVTASLDAIDFHAPVMNGNLVTLTGHVTHTSKRSIEIEVMVFTDNAMTGERTVTNSAYFTFVTLNALTGSVDDVPQLLLTNDAEQAEYDNGQQRYEERKRARKEGKFSYWASAQK